MHRVHNIIYFQESGNRSKRNNTLPIFAASERVRRVGRPAEQPTDQPDSHHGPSLTIGLDVRESKI